MTSSKYVDYLCLWCNVFALLLSASPPIIINNIIFLVIVLCCNCTKCLSYLLLTKNLQPPPQKTFSVLTSTQETFCFPILDTIYPHVFSLNGSIKIHGYYKQALRNVYIINMYKY